MPTPRRWTSLLTRWRSRVASQGATEPKRPAVVPILPLIVAISKVPAEYRPLHKYLNDRYADTVVLSFDEIEDLMGVALPDGAGARGWWATESADGSPTGQSRAWTQAGRTAAPNLAARTVVFERMPVR